MRGKFPNIEKMRRALFRAKEERRRALAQLPFAQKIRILVELQELYLSFNRKGKAAPWRPWK